MLPDVASLRLIERIVARCVLEGIFVILLLRFLLCQRPVLRLQVDQRFSWLCSYRFS